MAIVNIKLLEERNRPTIDIDTNLTKMSTLIQGQIWL